MAGLSRGEHALDKPDLLIIGLDRLGVDLALAASALGASVVLAMQGESASKAARRDGEILARLCATPFVDANGFRREYNALERWIAVTRSPERMRAARVRVEPETARFLDARRVLIGEREYWPRRIVIATGRIARNAADFLDQFGSDAIPNRVLVSGNGPLALPLASVAMRAGAITTLVVESRQIKSFDPDISALCFETLERRGLVVQTELPTLRPADVPIWLDPCFEPNLDNLDLDKAGVKIRDGQIVLGTHMECSNRRISVIGSVSDTATDAGMVGYLLARLMFRKPGRYRPPVRIQVIQTAPALAEVGLGEAEARKHVGNIRVHRASFSEVGPGLSAPGAVKLVCDSRDNLVGASILATDAVSLAATLALGIGNNLRLSAIGHIAWPPGVGGEALRLAANAPQRARLRSPRLQAALRLMRKFG